MTMSPIKRIPRTELPADYSIMWDTMDRLVGDPTAIEVLANNMEVTRWYFEDFYKNLFANANPQMQVSTHLKQLLRLRFSKQHGCALCNRGNEEQARASGFSDAQIDALLDPKPATELFTEAEHAVIEFADQMMLHNADGQLTKDRYDRLHKHFSDAQIVEMAMVSAVLVGAAKMMFVLDLVPRETNCPFESAHSVADAAA